MKHHDCRITTWGCIHRAATFSVLALTVASSSAADHTEIAHDVSSKSTPSATGLLDGRESHSNRPFFIQDPTDGLCLSGGTFKRCAVDTLWKVEGEAGRQAVRRVAVQEDGGYCCYCICCCTLYFVFVWRFCSPTALRTTSHLLSLVQSAHTECTHRVHTWYW